MRPASESLASGVLAGGRQQGGIGAGCDRFEEILDRTTVDRSDTCDRIGCRQDVAFGSLKPGSLERPEHAERLAVRGGDVLRLVDEQTRERDPLDAAPTECARDAIVSRTPVRRVVAARDDTPSAHRCRELRDHLRRIAAHDGERCTAGLERVCQR